MRKTSLLGAFVLVLVACGPDGPDPQEALEIDDQASALGGGCALGDEPDALPAAFDPELGMGEDWLADGRRQLVITRGDAIEPDATAEGRLAADTWALQRGTTVRDFGRSCELRVNDRAAVSIPNFMLLRFALPNTITCATISNASLVLVAAQAPAAPRILVAGRRVRSAWRPGATGAARCERCAVSTGAAAAFVLPAVGPFETRTFVDRPCARYSWNVTAMARDWCMNPAANFGIFFEGNTSTAAARTANFHSMEAAMVLRPRLVVTY